jgi:sigma-E factor negative regulatory protein RseA
MTEQISDQISAFIDDELSDEEGAFLMRRFERDADARSRAARYTMIGAALRDELVGSDPEILRRRVAAALTGTAPVAQQRPAARVQWRYLRPAVGVGIAATVAVAAIVGLRAVNFAHVGSPGGAATAPLQARASDAAPSYVVPREVSDAPVVPVAQGVRLTNYVMHHSEYASRLSRTAVHSNVVGAGELLPPAETVPAKRETAGE